MYGRSRLKIRGSDWLIVLILAVCSLMLSTWTLMFMVGNAHAWDSAIPTMGWTDAFGIILPVFLIAGLVFYVWEWLVSR